MRIAKTIQTSTIILLLALAVAGTAYAATTLEVGIPGVEGAAAGDTVSSVPTYIKYLYYFVLGLVGIAGFSSLVFWGAVWAGSGIVDKKAQAIAGIKNTLTGIGIALTAFILLNTINPDLIIIKAPSMSEINIKNNPKKEVLFVDYVAIWATLKDGQTCQSAYGINWVSTNPDKCTAEFKREFTAGIYNACCMQMQSATPDEVLLSTALRWVQINPDKMTCESILGPEWRKPDTSCPSYYARPPEAEGRSDYICCSKN